MYTGLITLRHLNDEPYRSFCLVALKTGMRQGELFALRWCDVDLVQAVVRVRRSYTGGMLGTPKNRERRDVDLISDVVELLTPLRGEWGSGNDTGLAFPATNGTGFLTPRSCSGAISTRRWLALASHGSGQRRRSERSTAFGTPLPSARWRVGHRSPGSPAISATPP